MAEKSQIDMQTLALTTARWRAGGISDAAYAGLYFLHWQAARHGPRFASRRRRADPRPDPIAWLEETADLEAHAVNAYLLRYFQRYQFFGVIDNVPAALAAWLKGEWPLTLCGHIPGPAEVLRMQTAGTRPVTVISAWPRLLAPVLGKPDAFAFMVHDLEHAFKFFHDPAMHREQREFFRALLAFLEAGRFDGYLADPVFAEKFAYASSDMNTHPFHAALYLRAILLELHLRREGLRRQWDLSAKAQDEVLILLRDLLGQGQVDAMERRIERETSQPAIG